MGKHESSIPEQLDSRFRGVDKTGMARVLGIIPSVRSGRKYCLMQVSSFL